MLRIRHLLACATLLPAPILAQQSVADYTRGFEKRDGYFPLYWDAAKGRLLLEIPAGRLDEDFLYLSSLATGLGDAELLGLDRGAIGDEQIARFERVGPRVRLVLQNPRFRAETDNAALARSVRESFPVSTVAAWEVLAEEGGRVLVDATPYVLSDVPDVRAALRGGNQGAFALDRERSSVYLPRTKAFPDNTEIEASLTFTSDNPGAAPRRHAPDARALTLRHHLSLVRLPPRDGFRPRRFDPRMGFFSVRYYDFAKPFTADVVTRYAVRHRLQKRDPAAAVSEPLRPIVYYLDPGVPEPYRTAFRQGAGWWNRVFEAAGFRNAFRVEDMPPDMDPLDARYHVIQWVHRTEASSSIGPTFVDPRSGEIIKAAVRMDSHRSLPDYDIYAGTVPALGVTEGFDPWLVLLTGSADVSAEAFAMARRRQHAAHEVGHTLGLAHNFVAASYGRASVMDYPAPLITLNNGNIDLTDAYRDGPGAWDSLAIRWGYSEFAADREAAALEAIAREGIARGLRFITNPDEAAGGSYAEATTWVNGSEMTAELRRMAEVRRFLLGRFDEQAIAPGEPLALLNRRFATVYLHHRFALAGAIKSVGGMAFRYALRGDSGPPTRIVPAAAQRRALEVVLDAVEPGELAVPERILRVLAPRPAGYESDSRAFASAAGPAFDQVGIARTLASLVVGGLLDPQRAARIVALADRDATLPTLTEVVGRIVDRTWGAPPPAQHAALQRVAQRVVVDELLELARSPNATPEARAAAEWGLRRIARRLTPARGQPADGSGSEAEAHRQLAAADIERFLTRRDAPVTPRAPLRAPVGTPIGEP